MSAAHIGEPRDPIEELLAGVAALERTRARPVGEETLSWVGLSRAEFYRKVEAGEIQVERAEAPARRNGRRSATRIRVTLLELARFRVRRMIAVAGPIEKAVTAERA